MFGSIPAKCTRRARSGQTGRVLSGRKAPPLDGSKTHPPFGLPVRPDLVPFRAGGPWRGHARERSMGSRGIRASLRATWGGRIPRRMGPIGLSRHAALGVYPQIPGRNPLSETGHHRACPGGAMTGARGGRASHRPTGMNPVVADNSSQRWSWLVSHRPAGVNPAVARERAWQSPALKTALWAETCPPSGCVYQRRPAGLGFQILGLAPKPSPLQDSRRLLPRRLGGGRSGADTRA